MEASTVGALVAAEPRGLAGVAVGMGPGTEAAEIAPGTAQPPCAARWVSAREEVRKRGRDGPLRGRR